MLGVNVVCGNRAGGSAAVSYFIPTSNTATVSSSTSNKSFSI